MDRNRIAYLIQRFRSNEATREELDELEEELELIDEMFEEFIGRNWRKKVKVGKAEEIDKDKNVTYYEVEVDVDGDESYLEVKKVKGKFYISDDASLSSVFW